MFFDVTDSFFMRHHSEIIAVALEDLVMHVKSRLAGCAVFSDFCHINALIKERQYCLNWQKKSLFMLRYRCNLEDFFGNLGLCHRQS